MLNLTSFFLFILRFVYSRYKLYTLRKFLRNNSDVALSSRHQQGYTEMRTKKESNKVTADFRVFVYASIERKKPIFGTNIQEEYMEKVLMYGYIMVRCNFYV